MKRFVTKSAIETRELAQRLGALLSEGSLVILTGDLGAGKTTFTQGLAKGLGIEKRVISPTFTILRIYQGRMPLYHIDAYRLEGNDADLGFEEMMEDDGVCVIEWPDFLRDRLPEEYLEISITLEKDFSRVLSVNARGEKYEKILEEWQ